MIGWLILGVFALVLVVYIASTAPFVQDFFARREQAGDESPPRVRARGPIVAAGALAVGAVAVVTGAPFPGRFHTEPTLGGKVLMKTDTWTGRAWIITTGDAYDGTSSWREVGR